MQTVAIWKGVDEWRSEAAVVELGPSELRASGTQIGADPVPYRLDYTLDVGPDWRTRRLEVEVAGDRFSRRLELRADGHGSWSCDASAEGELAGSGDPGGDAATLEGALDCDLGLSPLTNTMPIRRHRLAERLGAADIVCAWVSVPDLTVSRYPQRYEHLDARDGVATVRFIDRGPHEGFVADLELGPDGLVRDYPGLAVRV